MSGKLIITGATKGIGKKTAEIFASHGFAIAFCSRNPDEVSKFESYLKQTYQINCKGFVCDVSDKAQIEVFGKAALSFLNGCDVLINNAGIFKPGSIENEEAGVFEYQMAVNLNSAYYLTKVVIPSLKMGERPHVFNMCSIASIKAYPNGGSYCISKFALLGLTRVLRVELMPFKIAVTAVMPGATLTESWGETDLPQSRFIKPGDIASAIWGAYSINEHTVVEDLVMRPLDGDI